jgi:hypothetical protein
LCRGARARRRQVASGVIAGAPATAAARAGDILRRLERNRGGEGRLAERVDSADPESITSSAPAWRSALNSRFLAPGIRFDGRIKVH